MRLIHIFFQDAGPFCTVLGVSIVSRDGSLPLKALHERESVKLVPSSKAYKNEAGVDAHKIRTRFGEPLALEPQAKPITGLHHQPPLKERQSRAILGRNSELDQDANHICRPCMGDDVQLGQNEGQLEAKPSKPPEKAR